MRYLKSFELFESINVDEYYQITDDIKYILLELTDKGFNFRTALNNTENPTSKFDGKNFSVEIYNQTQKGLKGQKLGSFTYNEVSDYISRIYDYMISEKFISPKTEVKIDYQILDEGYEFNDSWYYEEGENYGPKYKIRLRDFHNFKLLNLTNKWIFRSITIHFILDK